MSACAYPWMNNSALILRQTDDTIHAWGRARAHTHTHTHTHTHDTRMGQGARARAHTHTHTHDTRMGQGARHLDARTIQALECVSELRKGTCLLPCDGVYTGGLRNVQPHGRGRATWPDGEEYRGQWWQGRQEGHGVLTMPKYLSFMRTSVLYVSVCPVHVRHVSVWCMSVTCPSGACPSHVRLVHIRMHAISTCPQGQTCSANLVPTSNGVILPCSHLRTLPSFNEYLFALWNKLNGHTCRDVETHVDTCP